MIPDLKAAHDRLAGILGPAEPLDVLERVEEHRRYWRPDKVRVLLLAESHVYTTAGELERSLRPELAVPPGLPGGYVRLVYSLGYGENEFLDGAVSKNNGSPQFWSIFNSCVAGVDGRLGSGSPLKAFTPDPALRLRAKLGVLSALRDRGVWLVDASVAAIYRPRQMSAPRVKQKWAVLQASWDVYTRAVVEAAAPEAVLCIGVGVVRCLQERLDRLGIRWAGVQQPQARLSAERHREIHRTYSAVCGDPGEIRRVPAI